MRKEQRLRLRKEFAVVYRKGRAQSSHLLVVRVLPNDRQVSRFGFVVGTVFDVSQTEPIKAHRCAADREGPDVEPEPAATGAPDPLPWC